MAGQYNITCDTWGLVRRANRIFSEPLRQARKSTFEGVETPSLCFWKGPVQEVRWTASAFNGRFSNARIVAKSSNLSQNHVKVNAFQPRHFFPKGPKGGVIILSYHATYHCSQAKVNFTLASLAAPVSKVYHREAFTFRNAPMQQTQTNPSRVSHRTLLSQLSQTIESPARLACFEHANAKGLVRLLCTVYAKQSCIRLQLYCFVGRRRSSPSRDSCCTNTCRSVRVS